jgi:hypothetical protein
LRSHTDYSVPSHSAMSTFLLARILEPRTATATPSQSGRSAFQRLSEAKLCGFFSVGLRFAPFRAESDIGPRPSTGDPRLIPSEGGWLPKQSSHWKRFGSFFRPSAATTGQNPNSIRRRRALLELAGRRRSVGLLGSSGETDRAPSFRWVKLDGSRFVAGLLPDVPSSGKPREHGSGSKEQTCPEEQGKIDRGRSPSTRAPVHHNPRVGGSSPSSGIKEARRTRPLGPELGGLTGSCGPTRIPFSPCTNLNRVNILPSGDRRVGTGSSCPPEP